jgi:hypothetical protein
MTMNDKRYQLGSSPRLSFQACVGDLHIQSWDQEEVQLLFSGQGETTAAQQGDGELMISGPMPEAVNVPPAASVSLRGCVGDVRAMNLAALHIEQHQGDLSVQQVGQVELKTMHGDVQTREVQSLQVTTLHGDLNAQAIAESVAIAAVTGDIALKEAKGQLALQDITGDVAIRNPAGNLEVRNVTGDLSLSGDLRTGSYHLQALGDVGLYLGTASDAHVEAEARLGHIACGLMLTDATESAHKLAGKMGQGTAQVQVVSQSGDVRLRPLGADHLRHEMEKERIRAEAHARRAAEHAQHLAEKAERHAAKVRRWQVTWSTPEPGASAPPRQEPMSPEMLQDERLAILKMLAEGKVSAEQAESLLNALEE